jgi:antitoxin component YwqK of YwqJK toxin-antitoxin module
MIFRDQWMAASVLERMEYDWPRDLRGAHLSHLDLRGLDLRGRSFVHADLSGADLRGALLDKADFSDAKLVNTKLDPDAAEVAYFIGRLEDLTWEPPTAIEKVKGKTYHIWLNSEGQAHRDPDIGPALIVYDADGKEELRSYQEYGTVHRVNGPAEIKAGGLSHHWLQRGQKHNDSGPALQRWDENGTLLEEKYYNLNATHREGAPAWRKWHPDGRLAEERWLVQGKPHRDGDEPAFQSWHNNGQPHVTIHQKDGKHHRVGAPALVTYNKAGQKIQEEYWERGLRVNGPNGEPSITTYYKDGTLKLTEYHHMDHGHHREDGPAVTTYYSDGQLHSESYCLNGKIERDGDLPAVRVHRVNGQLQREEWKKDGKYHREGAPAVITYRDGKPHTTEYWENGVRLRHIKNR